jgi:hypothetical protein
MKTWTKVYHQQNSAIFWIRDSNDKRFENLHSVKRCQMAKTQPPEEGQQVPPEESKPKTCLDCGFLTIEGRELSSAERIMLVANAGVMPAHPERTRCVKKLWAMYDLTYLGDCFQGVIDELERPRDGCKGFFSYQPGFTPEEHRQFQIRTPDFLANDLNISKKNMRRKTTRSNSSPNKVATRSWKDIEIRFLSDERIAVSNAGSNETHNYAEMGFEDGRKGTPTLAWQILKQLAESKGIIELETINGLDIPKLEKRVQEIRRVFRNQFGIPNDPLPYVKGTGYVAQFKISCAPSFPT